MLINEIETAQRLVRTDAYQMSIGELVGMYESSEIIIDPEFQRLFRWNISQKSKLIESILLGIPLPSIFVFEKDNGTWELIDGLQRLSTLLEFMGKLKNSDGHIVPQSVLEGTKYLPSLHNAVWDLSENIPSLPIDQQNRLDNSLQLAIKRARLSVEILKRPSDNSTKFDLFQRLNAGGTVANPQELRNCIMLMVNADFFRAIKVAAEHQNFQEVITVSEDQIERQRHMEYAVRFLVHTFIPYNGVLDVEEYIDDGALRLADENDLAKVELISETFHLLRDAGGDSILKRYENGRHTGRVGLVGLEVVAVGVAKNIRRIKELKDPTAFVTEKAQTFWAEADAANFTSPGIRGTTRIQKTVPFGETWFRP